MPEGSILFLLTLDYISLEIFLLHQPYIFAIDLNSGFSTCVSLWNLKLKSSFFINRNFQRLLTHWWQSFLFLCVIVALVWTLFCCLNFLRDMGAYRIGDLDFVWSFVWCPRFTSLKHSTISFKMWLYFPVCCDNFIPAYCFNGLLPASSNLWISLTCFLFT